jgi:catechol 2,3-dioxygenase-like lactoylglutathione lyase family enzyme
MMKTLVVAVAILALSWQQATAPSARPAILGVSHVTIQTSDLVKARGFYGDLLGFAEQRPARPHQAIFIVNARQRLIVRDGLPPDRDERFINVGFESDTPDILRLSFLRLFDVTALKSDQEAGGQTFDAKDPDGHLVQFVKREAGGPDGSATPDRRISRRILHIGLTIKDPAAADRFYKEALRFSETWRGGRPEGTTSWINMRVPDGTDYLEYMLYPTTPPNRRQLGSAHHVALMVQDIQQALETVRARTKSGDPNHTATPNIGVNNRWQLNVFDPDGTRVEFMEPWTVR